MQRKMMVSLVVVALMAALIGGATFAYFSDTATNNGNVFSSGTLDIVLNGETSDITAPVFNASNIFPGWSSGLKDVSIQNAGTLPAKVTATTEFVGDVDLAKYIDIYVYDGAGNLITTFKANAIPTPVVLGTMAAGAISNLQVEAVFTETGADQNDAQGKSFTLNLTVDAEQV